MAITTNIQQLIDRYKKLAEGKTEINFSIALVVGVNAAMGAMKFRIFNKGQDKYEVSLGVYTGKKIKFTGRTRNTDEVLDKAVKNKISQQVKKISQYLKDVGGEGLTLYERKRVAAGRQIKYKDLEFTGDLRRGIVVVEKEGEQYVVTCSIPNELLYDIAEKQENQIGQIRGGGKAEIFSLSNAEREMLIEQTRAAIKQLIYDWSTNPE